MIQIDSSQNVCCLWCDSWNGRKWISLWHADTRCRKGQTAAAGGMSNPLQRASLPLQRVDAWEFFAHRLTEPRFLNPMTNWPGLGLSGLPRGGRVQPGGDSRLGVWSDPGKRPALRGGGLDQWEGGVPTTHTGLHLTALAFSLARSKKAAMLSGDLPRPRVWRESLFLPRVRFMGQTTMPNQLFSPEFFSVFREERTGSRKIQLWWRHPDKKLFECGNITIIFLHHIHTHTSLHLNHLWDTRVSRNLLQAETRLHICAKLSGTFNFYVREVIRSQARTHTCALMDSFRFAIFERWKPKRWHNELVTTKTLPDVDKKWYDLIRTQPKNSPTACHLKISLHTSRQKMIWV